MNLSISTFFSHLAHLASFNWLKLSAHGAYSVIERAANVLQTWYPHLVAHYSGQQVVSEEDSETITKEHINYAAHSQKG